MKLFPIAIFRIDGYSMLPDFHPGDFIAVNQWAYIIGRPKVGDVVVLKNSKNLVKRIAAIFPEGIEVRGDNEKQSTDSRAFGLVPKSKVVGRVLLCFSGNNKHKSREAVR